MKTTMGSRLGWYLLGAAAPVLVLAAACATMAKEQEVYSQSQSLSRGVAVVAAGAQVAEPPQLVFKPFDFSPFEKEGGYDIGRPGVSRRSARWEDVKLYAPAVSITSPAPADVTLCFWVRDDVSFGWDTTLGVFCATIARGATTPGASGIEAFTRRGHAPFGSPPFHHGSFWLGCTEKGKVRGSEGRRGGEVAVYIESFGQLYTGGVAVDWAVSSPQSPRHRVRCL